MIEHSCQTQLVVAPEIKSTLDLILPLILDLSRGQLDFQFELWSCGYYCSRVYLLVFTLGESLVNLEMVALSC